MRNLKWIASLTIFSLTAYAVEPISLKQKVCEVRNFERGISEGFSFRDSATNERIEAIVLETTSRYDMSMRDSLKFKDIAEMYLDKATPRESPATVAESYCKSFTSKFTKQELEAMLEYHESGVGKKERELTPVFAEEFSKFAGLSGNRVTMEIETALRNDIANALKACECVPRAGP